jgi:hypothetical protein
MEQRRLPLFLSTILFFSVAGATQAGVVNTISIDMTAATPTADCTRSSGSLSCSSPLSNLNFTDIGGVRTLTFNYTSTYYVDRFSGSFKEYTQWVDNTSAIVGMLLVTGASESNIYSVKFCEPSCSTVNFNASPFNPVTVDYTKFQRGFEMDLASYGSFKTYVGPGKNAINGLDIYQVKLDQQQAPEPATLPLMVMAGAFGAVVFRRNRVKAARRVGSPR